MHPPTAHLATWTPTALLATWQMFFENLEPETTVTLLDNLAAGRPVTIGPQNGLKHSEGPMGRTSLLGEAAGPYCRELNPPPEVESPPPPAAPAAPAAAPAAAPKAAKAKA